MPFAQVNAIPEPLWSRPRGEMWVAADRNRIEARDMLRAIFDKNVGTTAWTGAAEKCIPFARLFLDNVVLYRSGHALGQSTPCFSPTAIYIAQIRALWRVDCHGDGDNRRWECVRKNLHVLRATNINAALGCRLRVGRNVVGIVAHELRQVEIKKPRVRSALAQ